MGGGVGIWVKLYPRVLFIFIFGSFNASTTAYPEKREFSLDAPKNISVVGVYLWSWFASGIKFSLFIPKLFSFFNGPNKAIILQGELIGNAPYG